MLTSPEGTSGRWDLFSGGERTSWELGLVIEWDGV